MPPAEQARWIGKRLRERVHQRKLSIRDKSDLSLYIIILENFS